jgi:putative transposase
LEILDGAVAAGATARRVAERRGISLRTLQRWRRQFTACDGHGGDRRKGSGRHVPHRLSEQERQEILAVCNQPQYASRPPAQIVPDLADQGRYLASESSFYRVLHAHHQVQRRGRARPPQAPRHRADGPNKLWSWDITYLPTGVRGVWLYLYLVLDVWSRKIVAWDVQDREDAKLAADLISRGCLRERISKRRQRQLNQHGQQQREVQKLLAVLVKQQLSPGAAPRP